jgi:hypothetical protein
MKLIHKNILACALGAGLIMVGAGKVQALVSDNSIAIPLSVKLTVTTTDSKGKVTMTRLTSKDLLNSLSDTVKGDQFAYFEGNVWIVNKKVLVDNLTNTFVIILSEKSSSDVPGKNGGFKDSQSGTCEVAFDSDEDADTDISDSTLNFDLTGIYSATQSATAAHQRHHNGNISETDSLNLSALGNEGFDSSVDDTETEPMSGSVSGSENGTVTGG